MKHRKKSNEDRIQELRAGLAIDKHSLDTEIQQQPQLFDDVSEEMVRASARRDFLKEQLANTDAELAGKHRSKIEKSGARATDAAVAQAVARDSKHIKAVEAHIKAREIADRFQALKEAYHQRSYMLRDLAALYTSNYYERQSIKDNSTVRDYKSNRVKEMREKAGRAGGSRKSRRAREK